LVGEKVKDQNMEKILNQKIENEANFSRSNY